MSSSTTNQKAEIAAYIAQLTPIEQKVLSIASAHLETSFSLAKSVGFQEWQAQAKQQQQQQAQAQAKHLPSKL